jgi:hypothetical protein
MLEQEKKTIPGKRIEKTMKKQETPATTEYRFRISFPTGFV